jgi:hypothetical protein
MRNVLLFPDGTEQDILYPKDREITEGQKLQVHMKDDSFRYLSVSHIQKTDKIIYYHLSE